MERTQIESAIESVAKRSQVSGGIFSEVERMVTPVQAGFEIAKYGIDPSELGQIPGFSPINDSWLMRAVCRGHRSEAGQSIREHGAA